MLFFRFPFQCDLKVLDYGINPPNAVLIKHKIGSYLGTDQFTLLCNGKLLHDADIIPDDSNIQVIFSLPGGKGGFGSMLRAIGAQIEKTTNREACRDLSGRRLRDINEEQRLKKWLAKEAEREAEKIRRRKERIERLKSQAPHKFFDFEYEKEISELPNRINDALSEGLQKAKQPAKRPMEKSEKPVKKTWLADDFPVSSSDSELEEGSPSKKPKLVDNVISSCDSDISESSQSLPGSSKDSSCAFDENSTSCDSKAIVTERKYEESHSVPSSSKDSSFVFDDSSVSCDSKTSSVERKCEGNSNMSDDVHVQDEQTNNNDVEQARKDPKTSDSAEITVNISMEDVALAPGTDSSPPVKNETENDGKDVKEIKTSSESDESPIDLLDFQHVSELEALGLDRLKSALMARGLKCGGTLRDRAQRLWKVRGLQPQEYPANLLAKNKK